MIDPSNAAKIAEWILAGMRLSQIASHIATHRDQWKGEEPTAGELLTHVDAAHELITHDASIDFALERAKSFSRLNFLYTKCCAIQDYKGAASIQREINLMLIRAENERAMRD